MLAGGVNLARDPRNGRSFEYFSEDSLLSDSLAGAAIDGIQSNHIISTVRHFALNGQETGRHFANSKIVDAAARESDLLAFQIAIERGRPGAVICAYNKVNGAQACRNDYLLIERRIVANRVAGQWQIAPCRYGFALGQDAGQLGPVRTVWFGKSTWGP